MSLPTQFLSYLVISSIATAINLIVGFSLYGLLGWDRGAEYVFAVALGYIAGMIFNFSLNRRLTFQESDRREVAQIRTFVIVAGVGLALTAGLASLLRSIITAISTILNHSDAVPSTLTRDTLSHILAVAAVAVYSFAAHKWLTFSHGIRFRIRAFFHLGAAMVSASREK